MLLLWMREIVGWLVVALGLFVLLVALSLCQAGNKYVEAVVAAAIGIFVFRGGIQVVKVATAARIVLGERQAAPELRPRN